MRRSWLALSSMPSTPRCEVEVAALPAAVGEGGVLKISNQLSNLGRHRKPSSAAWLAGVLWLPQHAESRRAAGAIDQDLTNISTDIVRCTKLRDLINRLEEGDTPASAKPFLYQRCDGSRQQLS
jgi:hypothetical protein